MQTAPTIALVVGLFTGFPVLAAEPLPPGILTGQAVIFGGSGGPLSQTPSPDNRALSVIFQSVQVDAQSDGKRSDATHLALQIPLTAGSANRLKAELRGSITASAGVECRMSLDGPDGRVVLMARNAPQAYLKTHLRVAADDKELKLLVGLRCTGRPGSRPSFFATIDSLDLSEVPKPKR